MSVPNVLFDDTDLDRLSDEIDLEFRDLCTAPETTIADNAARKLQLLVEKQFQAISETTGETPERFLCRFLRAAWQDLCEEGGKLYMQWQQWGDLSNEDMIKTYSKTLTKMGFTGQAVPTLAVALAVITLRVGPRAICEVYGQDQG